MLEHGIITAIHYEEGVTLCNVQSIREASEYRAVPVAKPFVGTYQKPEVGQKVVMGQLSDGQHIILGYLSRHTCDEKPDDMRPEELTIQVDKQTKVELDKRPDDLYDLDVSASGDIEIKTPPDMPDHKPEDSKLTVVAQGDKSDVEVRNEGDDGDINIQAPNSGNIDINSGDGIIYIETSDNGNVIIDGIDFDQHTHYYTWTDPAGSDNTDPPE